MKRINNSWGGPSCPQDANDPCERPVIQPKSQEGVKRARLLTEENIAAVFRHIELTSNSPYSDDAKFALSVYAGLRAGEIAGITTSAFLDADGEIGPNLIVGRNIAKNGRERVLPIHPRVRLSLKRLRKAHPNIDFVSFSHRGRIKRQKTQAVKDFFGKIYREVGLEGCSSHSGRRTFITGLAKLASEMNRTLRDVQVLAGHSRLETTQVYIDPSDDYADLVHGLGRQQSAPQVIDPRTLNDDFDDDESEAALRFVTRKGDA